MGRSLIQEIADPRIIHQTAIVPEPRHNCPHGLLHKILRFCRENGSVPPTRTEFQSWFADAIRSPSTSAAPRCSRPNASMPTLDRKCVSTGSRSDRTASIKSRRPAIPFDSDFRRERGHGSRSGIALVVEMLLPARALEMRYERSGRLSPRQAIFRIGTPSPFTLNRIKRYKRPPWI